MAVMGFFWLPSQSQGSSHRRDRLHKLRFDMTQTSKEISLETASACDCHVSQLKLSQVFPIHMPFYGIKTSKAEALLNRGVKMEIAATSQQELIKTKAAGTTCIIAFV